MYVFGNVGQLNPKFCDKELFVIKRLNELYENNRDFNYRGSGEFTTYQGKGWSKYELPCDSMIVASIFTAMMDTDYEIRGAERFSHHLLNHLEV